MLASFAQPENAEEPMLVTLAGTVIEVSSVQPLNAEEPMIVTLVGMVIASILIQSLNAEELMLVPPVITTLFSDVGTHSPLAEYEDAPKI